MTRRPTSGPRLAAGYDERLRVPWWWWPPALAVAVLLAVEIHMGYPRVPVWAPLPATAALAAAYLLWLGRIRVRVRDEALWVGDAHLPLRFVGRVDVVAAEAKRRALGPELDPAAFVVHRGWVGAVVRLEVTDPEDPTPYWVISAPRPGLLLAVLGRGRPVRPRSPGR